MAGVLELYNLALGVLSGVGLIYLAYTQRFIVVYRRFIYLLIAGLLLFAVGGPLMELVAPDFSHLVHGVSALFVVLGLYDPVHNDLRKDEWARLLVREPSELRHPGEWMVPLDDEILELFHSVHLVLTPAIIAYNLDRSREEVNRRLSELVDRDLVNRVERGKYHITTLGEEYLRGELDPERPKPPE